MILDLKETTGIGFTYVPTQAMFVSKSIVYLLQLVAGKATSNMSSQGGHLLYSSVKHIPSTFVKY